MRYRSIAFVLVAVGVLGACGGGSSDGGNSSASNSSNAAADGERLDAAGNPIPAGADWSPVGDPTGSGTDAGDASAGRTTTTVFEGFPCNVPTTDPDTGEGLPPGPDDPFGEPDNDFPMTASVNPKRGDPLTEVEVTVVAPGQSNALVVLLASFWDGHHHGMRAAQFADATGRAVLRGEIPETAPVGQAKFTISVSNSREESAVATEDFVVTGPGCE